eukprot:scaffold116739_cov18-Tisochrysis_lutea.AAC.1
MLKQGWGRCPTGSDTSLEFVHWMRSKGAKGKDSDWHHNRVHTLAFYMNEIINATSNVKSKYGGRIPLKWWCMQKRHKKAQCSHPDLKNKAQARHFFLDKQARVDASTQGTEMENPVLKGSGIEAVKLLFTKNAQLHINFSRGGSV